MPDMQHAIFVISILAGYILYPALPALSNIHRKFTSLLILAFAAVLTLCDHFLDAYQSSLFIKNSLFLLIESMIRSFLTIFIGVICGVLLQKCRAFIYDTKNNNFFGTLIYISSFSLLLIFGAFRSEIGTVISQLDSLSTSYFSISFKNNSGSDEPSSFISNDRTGIPTTETDALFESGADIFMFAAAAPELTAKRVRDFCPENNRFSACKSRLTDKKSYERNTLMIYSLVYSSIFDDFHHCIKRFSQLFPNGVPIKDELSSLSVDYSYSLLDVNQLGILSDEDYKKDVTRIIKTIAIGAYSDNNAQYKNCNPDLTDPGSNKNSIDKKITTLSELRTIYKGEEIDYYIPYRSIIGSAILLMSGHPTEAASHIEKTFSHWMKVNEITQSTFNKISYDKVDILTFMTGLDLMWARIQLFRASKMKDKVPEKQHQLIEFITRFLSVHTNIDDANTKSIVNIEKTLTICRKIFPTLAGSKSLNFKSYYKNTDRKDIDIGLSFLESSRTNSNDATTHPYNKYFHTIKQFMGPTPADEEKSLRNTYILKLIKYLIINTPEKYIFISETKNYIDEYDIHEAKTLYEVAVNKPELIEECFGEALHKDQKGKGVYKKGGYDHRVVRFQFAYAYGMILARKASEVQRQSRLLKTDRNSARELKSMACRVEKIFQKALVFAQDTADDSPFRGVIPHGSIIRDNVYRILDILQQINPLLCQKDI
jgi:hypothetical protein